VDTGNKGFWRPARQRAGLRRWTDRPLIVLLLLLQRTPVLRVILAADGLAAGGGAGAVVRSLLLGAVGLGATHALAGATQFVQNPANPIKGTVGQQLSAAFTVIGSPNPPTQFIINDPLPPGLDTVPKRVGDTVFSDTRGVVVTGTPTQAGSYSVRVTTTDGTYTEDDTLLFQIAGGTGTPPQITTQPAATQSVNVGANVTLSVSATGSPAPNYQWKFNGNLLPGATAATLPLTNVQPGDAGIYTVVVSNSAGSVISTDAALNVATAGGTPPTISVQPSAQVVAPGGTVVFSVTAANATSYQWRRDGAAINGAIGPTLVLSGSGVIPAQYSVVITGSGTSITSSNAALAVSTTSDVGRLANLAIRTNAGTGAQTLIVGFVIGGDTGSPAKPLLIRGVGPTLTVFGVPGALADPLVVLLQGSTGAELTRNDDWGNDAAIAARATQVGAFPLQATADAALAVTEPANASYTVQITGKGGATGIALAEIYDATTGAFTTATPRLINVAARTFVGTGGNILIAGFVVGGSTGKTLLIRGVGPTLGAFGVPGALADPQLQLFDGNSTLLRQNDNWGGDSQLSATAAAVGAFPIIDAASKDAMLLVTLAPGSYTAQVSGVGNTTGVALVEVYEVP